MYEHEYYNNIRIKLADNGGFVLEWTHYVPAMNNSESMYEDHVKVFGTDQEEDLLKAIEKLHKDNLEMLKDYHKKMTDKHSNPKYMDKGSNY